MKKILGISLILIGIFSGGMGIAVMGGGLAIPGFLVIAFGIYLFFSSEHCMHNLQFQRMRMHLPHVVPVLFETSQEFLIYVLKLYPYR